MWLWHEKDYFSFDVGSRIAEFVEYLDERQFTPEAVKLASLAREETLKLRRQFASVSDAARYLPKQARKYGNPWTELAAAIALGYVGKASQSRSFFEIIKRRKTTHEWEEQLRATARTFAQALGEQMDFRRKVDETIWRTRKLLKLPETDDLNLSDKRTASM
jgi:heme oxygenase